MPPSQGPLLPLPLSSHLPHPLFPALKVPLFPPPPSTSSFPNPALPSSSSILVWRPGKPFPAPSCHCTALSHKHVDALCPLACKANTLLLFLCAWRCAAYVCIALGMRRACWPQSMPGPSGPPSITVPPRTVYLLVMKPCALWQTYKGIQEAWLSLLLPTHHAGGKPGSHSLCIAVLSLYRIEALP